MLTVPDVAKMLRLTDGALRTRLHRDRTEGTNTAPPPADITGRRVLFDPVVVDRWFAERACVRKQNGRPRMLVRPLTDTSREYHLDDPADRAAAIAAMREMGFVVTDFGGGFVAVPQKMAGVSA